MGLRRSSLVTIHCPDTATFRRVLQFNDGFLGRVAGVSDADALERFSRCPGAFHCVVDPEDAPDGGARPLYGYFILLPLTSECVSSIRAGTITSSRQIRNQDLACSGSLGGIYLSVVCAAGPFARSAVIAGGIKAIADLYHVRGARHLFVRAATGEGAHMLTRLTGQEFHADGVIHEVDLSAYDEILRSRI